MKKSVMFRLGMALLIIVALIGCAPKEKPKVTFFWALYDGLTEDYRASVEKAFNDQSKDSQIQIVPVKWDDLQNKLTTAVAGGTPPDISVVGTRWILDFMSTNSVDEVTQYVSKATLDNINPAAMEAKVKGKLMGLPLVAGARILAINNAITKAVPKTMEELEADAIKINKPPKVYGLIMPGKSHTELTDFCYYFYAAGGNYFEAKADGSYGKCTVNSDAGVKALTFMAKLALKDKVVQSGFTSMTRMDSHPVFYAGQGRLRHDRRVGRIRDEAGRGEVPRDLRQHPVLRRPEARRSADHRLHRLLLQGKEPEGGGQVHRLLLPGRVQGQVRPAGRVPAHHADGCQGSVLADPALPGPQRGGNDRAARGRWWTTSTR